MGRFKSLISGRVKWERAKHAHDCSHNASHRIEKGDLRLSIPNKRSATTYCAACGREMLRRDVVKLQGLLSKATDDD